MVAAAKATQRPSSSSTWTTFGREDRGHRFPRLDEHGDHQLDALARGWALGRRRTVAWHLPGRGPTVRHVCAGCWLDGPRVPTSVVDGPRPACPEPGDDRRRAGPAARVRHSGLARHVAHGHARDGVRASSRHRWDERCHQRFRRASSLGCWPAGRERRMEVGSTPCSRGRVRCRQTW